MQALNLFTENCAIKSRRRVASSQQIVYVHFCLDLIIERLGATIAYDTNYPFLSSKE